MATIEVRAGHRIVVDEEFVSGSVERTVAWGRDLGARIPPGSVIGLVGGLGSGKTVLAGAILGGAGLARSEAVTSPTFTLMNCYSGPIPLVHIDLYRLDSELEACEAGIEEAILVPGQGIVVVEWFDRFSALWPEQYLRLDIAVEGPVSRRITSSGAGGPSDDSA